MLRPFGKGPVSGWDRATTKFRDRTVLLLRARWHWITLATVVSHLSLFVVLLLALRFVGVSAEQVSVAEALAVFAFARLLTAIPFTPGGLGVIELALITGLSAAGGPRALVAAAVLIFRALTYVLPIPIGLGTYIFWRRNRSWRRRAELRAADRAGAGVGVSTLAPSRPAADRAGWPDVGLVAAGAAVLVLAALPVDAERVGDAEAAVFRVLNGTTVLPFVLVWPVMQLGNVLVVPASAAVAAALRRWRLAGELLVAGAATYLLAKVVKGIVPARPARRPAGRRGDPRRRRARPRLRVGARGDPDGARRRRLAVAGPARTRSSSPSSSRSCA